VISKAHRSLIRTTLYSCSALFCLGTAALADTNVNAASTANVQDETVAPTAIAQAVAPSDTVATPEATEEVDPYRLRRGLRERDFSVGYGKKIQISRFKERTKVTMYQLLPRWGRFKDDRQEFIWELPITYFSKPETAYAAGLSLMYRYHFSSNRRFAPFVEAGSGFVFTNLDDKIDELTGGFQFSPQAGIGIRSALSPSSDLIVSARWFHLSNAGTRTPNVGLNNYMITAGYSKLF
jgi:Lipid A 3-O-deacylase (PagL).